MDIEAKIELDSIGPAGKRLTTYRLKYPRFVHAEVLTHRSMSRNSASSRAIPTKKFREMVKQSPAMPVYWGKNQSGMQAEEELEEGVREAAERTWLMARDEAVMHHAFLEGIDLHKQLANRILEPWMSITVLVTATEFGGWFKLRDHRMAQPEIRELAAQMRELYKASTPQELKEGEWHMPLLPDRAELESDFLYEKRDLLRISTGRIARVSYLNHDGTRDPAKDIELHNRLLNTSDDPGHYSPFEHIAQAMTAQAWNDRVADDLHGARFSKEPFNPMKLGNLVGWYQYRKWIAEERNLDESGFSYDWRKQG